MKKTVLSIVLITLVLVTSAVVHLPAKLVVQYAPLPAPLRLVGVSGTLWQGAAKQVKWQNQNYGELNWQLNVAKLFAASLEAKVRFGRGSDLALHGRGVVGYSTNGLYATDVIASLPVEKVIEFAPRMPIPLDLNGQVELTLRSFAYGAPYCHSAEGSLVWNTEVIGTPISDLKVGPVIADFKCQDNSIDATGEQQSDQVESRFTAKLNPDRSYAATAWFKPLAEFPEQFKQQLKWMPTPADNQGKFHFSYQGRF